MTSGNVLEDVLATNSPVGELDVRRPRRAARKGITDLAADVLRDVADLFRAELQLLQAEVAEKLTFTALSICIIAAGALFLVVTVVLLLQAAIAELVAYGVSWPAASLIVAASTFILGGGLSWYGLNRLRFGRLTPTKTLDQVQKDINITNKD
jgi:Putative Actinobacterial Holin-X, holin superfamily III